MNDSSISLFICGDFYASDVENLKFSEELASLIAKADIAVCNFEGPVESTGKKIPKSGPSLIQSKTAPQFLENVGFDVALLANNHIMDYGKEGCDATISCFNTAIVCGAGCRDEAYEVKTIRVKGKIIGFLSLSHKEFGTCDGRETYGSAWICAPKVQDIIREAKTQVDYLFVFPHAGIEHIDVPLPEWREVYTRIIDWGADGVFGSHPHCPQGWETYNGNPIYYSLGNFYFDKLSGGEWWDKGLFLMVNIEESITVKTGNSIFKTNHIDIDASNTTLRHNDYLLSLLKDEKSYNAYLDNIAKKLYDNYVYNLMRSVDGVSFSLSIKQIVKCLASIIMKKGNRNMLLNDLQCESHRWMLERCIRVSQNEHFSKI